MVSHVFPGILCFSMEYQVFDGIQCFVYRVSYKANHNNYRYHIFPDLAKTTHSKRNPFIEDY
jgi:hypothetical protein